MTVQRTQTFRVARAPHITWYAEKHPTGELWMHFACAHCGDESMKRCENFEARGTHWVSVYTMNHVHSG